MSLSIRFQTVLKDQRLSQKRFCEITGYNQQSFSRFVSGTIANPGSNLLLVTAEYFPHINTEWLLSGRGEMYKKGFSSTGEKLAEDSNPAIEEKDLGNDFKYLGKSGQEEGPFAVLLNSLQTKDTLIKMYAEKVENLEAEIARLKAK